MMIRTGRRRLPVLFAAIAALAVAGTVLGLLFSEVDAHTPTTAPTARSTPTSISAHHHDGGGVQR